MKPSDNPNWFANSPLTRLNIEHDQGDFFATRLADPASLLLPLWRGDPLIADGNVAFLSAAARDQFPKDAPVVFLGLKNDTAHFAIDLSSASETPEGAPFAELGEYTPLRMVASKVSRDDLAIIGHGRWLFDWHRKHLFCARCGAATQSIQGGAKRQCPACKAEHFPRSDPVAIVLAIHDDACLLGRSGHFPPGFLSALAGYVEPAETPEEAAKRELFEEAGVTLTDIRYQFSQPWPFTGTMMMGFIADTENRELTLDTNEIVEARWINKSNIQTLLKGGEYDGVFIPPKFTIARQLLEVWAG